MHGDSAKIWDGVENGAPNCVSLGQLHVRPKGKEVPRDAVWHGNRSHTGRPRVPHDIQYRCGRCGERKIVVSLRTLGGVAWDGVGGRRVQPDILRGRREDQWEGTHMGTRRPDVVSCDVTMNGTGDESGYGKGPGVPPQVHLG